MKTSFYFVLWTAIYPLLGLLHSETVRSNGFLFALLVVFGISWLLRKAMPRVLGYETAARTAAYLEPVYRGDVAAFRRLVRRDAVVESVSGAYFAVTTAYILILVFSGEGDWFDLMIFALLLWAAASRANALLKAVRELSDHSVPAVCVQVAEKIYRMDYASFYEAHAGRTLAETLPPRPRTYTAFLVVSIIISALCILCGIVYMVIAFATEAWRFTAFSGALTGMTVLYGLLAIYFGVRDLMSCARSLKPVMPE